MTHWVICIDNSGTLLYAGSDRLAVGEREVSSLSGARSGNRQEDEICKIVKVEKGNKSCIICCGDSGDLASLEMLGRRRAGNHSPNDRREDTTSVVKKLLASAECDFTEINTAYDLLHKLALLLRKYYLLDNENSLLLGCGFANYTASTTPLSVASYDSRVTFNDPVFISQTGYLTMANNGRDNIRPTLPSGNSADGEPQIIRIIREKIHQRSLLADVVGRHVDIEGISPKASPNQQQRAQRAAIASNPEVPSQNHCPINCRIS